MASAAPSNEDIRRKMKITKQLTPKSNQKSTPNSEGKIKKSNKKKPAVSSPGKVTPNSAGKIKEKTPKPTGKSPQSNGQTPIKKGLKTPKLDGKVKNALAYEEDAKTPDKPTTIANNSQNKTASVKKQKKLLGKTPQSQKVSRAQKRKESPNSESDSTPPKQVKTSPGSKEEKVNKRVRSVTRRLEARQQKKEQHQQLLNRLKERDETVVEDAEKFKAKLAELQNRPKLSKSGSRTMRRYKRYLNMINAIQNGDKIDSNLNKSALEHLKNMKKTKSKQQPNGKASVNAKNKINPPKGDQSKCEVFVKNLPYEIQTEEIAEHFKQVGEVVNVTVPLGREKKGIAFVQFENEEICQKALTLNQTVLKGRKINVLNKDIKPGGVKKSRKRT